MFSELLAMSPAVLQCFAEDAWAGHLCILSAEVYRPICWRLFLGVLPMDSAVWAAQLNRQENDYLALKSNIFPKPSKVVKADPLSSFLGDKNDTKSQEFDEYFNVIYIFLIYMFK